MSVCWRIHHRQHANRTISTWQIFHCEGFTCRGLQLPANEPCDKITRAAGSKRSYNTDLVAWKGSHLRMSQVACCRRNTKPQKGSTLQHFLFPPLCLLCANTDGKHTPAQVDDQTAG